MLPPLSLLPISLMKRFIIAIVAGAIVAFTCSLITTTLTDRRTPSTFTNPSEVEQVILANAPTHGIYTIPLNKNSLDQTTAINKGPYIRATIRPGALNKPRNIYIPLAISFFIHTICSLIIAISVRRIRATRYISRASIGVTLGVFAAICMELPRWNSFETPTSHVIINMLDPIISYTLAGLIIASIITRPKQRRIFS